LPASPKSVEFVYLDQEAMLGAGVLDMRRAIDVVWRAQGLFAAGKVQQPHKMVLRREETAESEDRHGRFNGLSALIGGADPCTGMKWIGSYPSNRKIGMPRASALIIRE
jgi:N-[(2S)-2-amino-2-carboxyethyl]-L-glutamate dehydrogenase